jgi:hypothetical protein
MFQVAEMILAREAFGEVCHQAGALSGGGGSFGQDRLFEMWRTVGCGRPLPRAGQGDRAGENHAAQLKQAPPTGLPVSAG